MTVSKVLLWLKKYWWLVVIGVGFILCSLFYKQGVKFFLDLLRVKEESHEKELEIVKEAEVEKEKERQRIERKYRTIIKRLEKEHAKVGQEFGAREKRITKKIIKKYKNDQIGLSRRLSSEFGITFVEREGG